MSETFTVESIATVSCSRTEAFDDHWNRETSVIRLHSDVLGPESVTGLEKFSHIEVVYILSQVSADKIVTNARHPRGNRDWPAVGILAQRGKNRPNRIGVTICQLISVAGTELSVKGLDAIDGTPVVDIKPVMSGFLPATEIHEPEWAREIMNDYW